MAIKITDEDRNEAQQLLRDVILILGDVSDLEQRAAGVKEKALKLYKRLDDTTDG